MDEKTTAVKISELLQADQEAMCIEILSKVYGVDDAMLRTFYIDALRETGWSKEKTINVMLNLLPKSALRMRSSSFSRRERDIRDAFKGIMDPAPLGKIPAIIDSMRQNSGSSAEFLLEEWEGIERLESLSKNYFSRNENMLRRNRDEGTVEAGLLNGKYLIVAYAKGTGLFTGPNVHFHGIQEADEHQRFSPGWIFHGPKIDVDSGSYVLNIDIKCHDPDARMIIDVVANGGLNKILELKTIGNAQMSLGFEIERFHKGIEVRCLNDMDHDITGVLRRVSFGMA